MTTTTRVVRRHRLAATVLAASLACIAPGAALGATAVHAEAFNDAMELYAQSKWSAAFGIFARLADDGEPEAAAIALLMLRYAVTLYGQEWGASPAQSERWKKLALQRMESAAAATGD